MPNRKINDKQALEMYTLWKDLRYPIFKVIADVYKISPRTAACIIGKLLNQESQERIAHDNKQITITINHKPKPKPK